MAHPIIIIGTGLAGYQLAREWRKLDTTTPLTLITQDDGSYYPKPQLSTALSLKKTAAMLKTSTAEQMAEQLHATILTHTKVDSIHPDEKIIRIGDKIIPYEKLVLACGAEVIKAPIQGQAVSDILSINHIYHYSEFQERIQHKKTIAILGAGLIGCEFANDLSNAGYKVHMIAPVSAPLDLLVPREIGQLLQDALQNQGVTCHFPSTASRFDKTNDHYELELSNGSVLQVDFLLSAIGLKPHIELAEKAHLNTNRGIIVNHYLETSEAHIYALGDCAEVCGHVLPYITPILNCSRALAKTLTGINTRVEYPAMPVMVKTPILPIAICPPPKNSQGQWTIEKQNNAVRALFHTTDHQLVGFVLTHDAVKDRNTLAKELPMYF